MDVNQPESEIDMQTTSAIEAAHAEANWLNNQPRDVVREQFVTVGHDNYKVRITDACTVWVMAGGWMRCGLIVWGDVAETIAEANRLATVVVLAELAKMPREWLTEELRDLVDAAGK